MKEYKIGYLEGKYVIEVIARTTEEKINGFLNIVDNADLENTEARNISCYDKKGEELNVLTNSSAIKSEFRTILESETIDLTNFRKLIYSGSKLCNTELLKIMQYFFEMFDYELYFSYENAEFNRIYRMVCLLGTTEDKKHYLDLANSIVGNTDVMQFFNRKGLVESSKLVAKNKQYKLIDKNED